MKIPLSYQRSEYDCGPTTMLNAISYLFKREEIPPDVLKYIMMYCLDTFDESGCCGKSGTSQMAMMFLSNWLNQYGRVRSFPIHCEYLSGPEVAVTPNSKIMAGLQQGGVVVLRLMYECWHYVLLTGADSKAIYLFDPYFRMRPYPQKGIDIVENQPTKRNRRVTFNHFNCEGKDHYALGPKNIREAVLVFNTGISGPMNLPEYFI